MKKALYSVDEIDRIKTQFPIVSFLEARGISFQRSGSLFKTRCLFHDDPDPSFFVYPEDNHYYCFGCGEHGDVISLVMRLYGVGFLEACQRLGGNASASSPKRAAAFSNHYRKTQQKEDEEKQLRSNAKAAKEQILKEFAWPLEDILQDSPTPLGDYLSAVEARLMIVTLFDPHSTIWIGGIHDSGRVKHSAHFQKASVWANLPDLPGSRITPSIFRSGEYRRQGNQVIERPYIVIEADEAIGKKPDTEEEKTQNRLANAALIRWCRDGLRMELVAVVDTGNKSLHGWFRKPENPRVCHELEVIAIDLGIDHLFKSAAQPVRLPGFIHEKSGRRSRLLWLKAL